MKNIYFFLVPQGNESRPGRMIMYNRKENKIMEGLAFESTSTNLSLAGIIGASIGILGVPDISINKALLISLYILATIFTIFITQKSFLKNSVEISLPYSVYNTQLLNKKKKQLLVLLYIISIIVISFIAIVIYLMYAYQSIFLLPIYVILVCILAFPCIFIWDLSTDKAMRLIKKEYSEYKKFD